MEMAKSLIGLGSNKSLHPFSPKEIVFRAYSAISALGENAFLSPLYESVAWPDPSDPPYVNAVAMIEVDMTSDEMLASLQAIEAAFSRIRSEDPQLRYAPRTLDLDLLSFGDEVRKTDHLTLPHPRLADRIFVLQPLFDVSPTWTHPETGESVEALLRQVKRAEDKLTLLD